MKKKNKTTKEILLKVPKLRFANLAPDVWQALDKIPRTGWKNRKVKNPETVQEHTLSLRKLAFSLLTELPPEEQDGLLEMLEVHDWPEKIEGDEAIIESDTAKEEALRKDKLNRERRAMRSICSPLGRNGDEIFALWIRFETSTDPAATFAGELDKYQAIEKALEYESEQQIPLYKEFLNYAMSKNQITHPLLLKKLEELERAWKLLQ